MVDNVAEGEKQLEHFTPAMAGVPRDPFPKKYVRGLPPYDLPLICRRGSPRIGDSQAGDLDTP